MSAKRFLALALSLTLMAPLAVACGSKSGSKGFDIQAVKNVKLDPNVKDTLKVWDYPNGSDFEQFRKDQIAAFQKKYPNVKVDLEILTWNDGPQKMDVALNAGDPPDVYFQTAQTKFMDSGLAVPLEDFYTAEDKADFTKASMDLSTYKGHIWEFGMWNSMQCLAGNRPVLEKAGIDWRSIQQNGWTWDQFTDITKKLTQADNGAGKKQFGFITYGNSEIVTQMFKNAGLPYEFSDDGKFLWTGEKAVAAAQFLRNLVDQGILPKEIASIDAKKMTDMYNNWEAPIFGRVGPYAITERETNKKKVESGQLTPPPQGLVDPVLLPWPHKAGEKEVPITGGAGLYVFRQKNYKGDVHTRLAIELAHFLTSGEGGPDLDGGLPAAKLLILPARKSSAKYFDEYANKLNMGAENIAFLKHEIEIAVPPKFYSPEINKAADKIFTDVITPSVQAFWANEITPQQFVDRLTQGANQILGAK